MYYNLMFIEAFLIHRALKLQAKNYKTFMIKMTKMKNNNPF